MPVLRPGRAHRSAHRRRAADREAHLDYPGGVALLANRIVIDDDLFADRTFVNGELDLAGARVGGVLVLIGSTLRNEGRRALYANNLSVGSGLLARFGFSATGEVALIHATIGRVLEGDTQSATVLTAMVTISRHSCCTCMLLSRAEQPRHISSHVPTSSVLSS